MHPTSRVVLNNDQVHRVACAADVDRLCKEIAEMPVFFLRTTCESVEARGELTIIAESGLAAVDFLDIGRGIKLASQNEECTQRGFRSLGKDAYPGLQLGEIEIQYRGLISPVRALAILRHFLTTGEPTDMVPWPPDDWKYWCGPPRPPDPPGEGITF